MSPENRSNEDAAVEAMLALCETATPAPWYVDRGGEIDEPFWQIPSVLRDRYGANSISSTDRPTIEFIAAARSAVPSLLARLAAVERERDDLRAANHAAMRLIREHADVAAERDALAERLGECIGCNYNDGPDECCPQHGRTITEWIDIASTVIGRQHAIEAERDAALARIAAVEAELAALGTPTTEYRRQFKSSSAWHVSVNGPFAEPSNRLRDRVVDEYRIVGEWRSASPTPESATCEHGEGGAHFIADPVCPMRWERCSGPATPEPTEETP